MVTEIGSDEVWGGTLSVCARVCNTLNPYIDYKFRKNLILYINYIFRKNLNPYIDEKKYKKSVLIS